MTRILLVDDGTGGRSAALTAVAKSGCEIVRVDSSDALTRLARLAEEGVELVLLTPATLEKLLTAPAGADVLRDAFEVFDDGVCLVAPNGALEVANATGARLWAGPLRSELEAAAREALSGKATSDRGLF